MSTADNATILLAAQIGQYRPAVHPGTIAIAAGKLIKICTTIRKRIEDNKPYEYFVEKAGLLAREVGAGFASNVFYYGDAKPYFFLEFDNHENRVRIEV